MGRVHATCLVVWLALIQLPVRMQLLNHVLHHASRLADWNGTAIFVAIYRVRLALSILISRYFLSLCE